MLPAIVDSIDSLAPPIAAEYTAGADGKFYLQVSPVDGYALEDIGGLKTALGKERENNTASAAKLAAFGDLDPTAAHGALAKVAEMRDWTPDQKTKDAIESSAKQLAEKHAAELGLSTAEVEDLRGQLEKQLITNDAVAAIVEHGGNVDLLLPHVVRQMRMEKADGKYVGRVIDENGTPRVSMQTGSIEGMGVGELVESMRSMDSFSPAFAGSGASGSGAAGSRAAGSGGKGDVVMSWDEAHNHEAYQAAQVTAEKQGGQVVVLPFEG